VSGDGVLIKQPATLSANQTTGQLTVHVHELPQLPFSKLRLKVHGGTRAPLANPQSCGSQTTTSAFTPWSGGPDATPFTSFAVDWDGQGGTCPAEFPFAPSFTSGGSSSTAGVFSPLGLSLSRQDREQNLSGLSVTLPPGELAKLAGVERCPDALATTGQCPAGSKIGTLTAAVGPGATPLVVHGDVYLTAPYRGQPFGEAAVIHAQAGPFNLGDVVVRGAIHIDRSTAQATVVSDPFPQIVDGVRVRTRAVNVLLDRPGFTFNPTSCEQEQLHATISSSQGAAVNVTSPFAATGCRGLPFKPVFRATIRGRASKRNGAALDVRVSSRGGPQPGGGEANIAKVKVSLPKSLPTRLVTLQQACVAHVFEANPAACPAAATVGTATASTPLLASPLSGPAILVSHGGTSFPDLDIVLQGEGVTLVLVGNTEIRGGITTSTFNTIPDAPVSSFELRLPTGRFSILGAFLPVKANYSFCGQRLSMPTTITAQNGAVVRQATRIATSGCRKASRARRAARHGRGRSRHGRRTSRHG
jgi:hypothetical protein